jgi:hypothetical protein
MREFKGSTWRDIRSAIKQQYLMNKYRVLLSRAREGMIVWVPPGDPTDPTREPARLDRHCRVPTAGGPRARRRFHVVGGGVSSSRAEGPPVSPCVGTVRSFSPDDVLADLKRQACLSGADALIDISERTSSHAETRIYHLTAIGVKLK